MTPQEYKELVKRNRGEGVFLLADEIERLRNYQCPAEFVMAPLETLVIYDNKIEIIIVKQKLHNENILTEARQEVTPFEIYDLYGLRLAKVIRERIKNMIARAQEQAKKLAELRAE